jgi:endonuclease/exonuclease/phosphatase family metal-dependent hydrolase
MKIMTWNIHGWRTMDGQPNLDRVTETIAAAHADIVGLNEAFHPQAEEGSTEPILEVLARRLDMHFVFGPCMRWPVQDNLPADAFGNALLSRWPIIASAAHHLTPKETHLQKAVKGKRERGLLEARVRLPNGEAFTLYVLHLDHTEEEARLVQLRTARTWLGRDRNRPHVVMGDFNAINPWDYANRIDALEALSRHPKGGHMVPDQQPKLIPQMERAGYTDVMTLYGARGQQSFIPATEGALRLDYIFASRPLLPLVKSCEIWMETQGREASDHRPVVANVQMPLS